MVNTRDTAELAKAERQAQDDLRTARYTQDQEKIREAQQRLDDARVALIGHLAGVFSLPLPAFGASIHNVRLVAVQSDGAGFERLQIEHNGAVHDVQGAGRWSEDRPHWGLGKFGELVRAELVSIERNFPDDGCYFRPYVDQSLRRSPELDAPDPGNARAGRAACTVGWRCAAKLGGFRAPPGLIPGDGGDFVQDETQDVVVPVPPEFFRLCKEFELTPVDVLRDFIADAAGLQSFVTRPRADRYSSNGSDERDYADNYLDRAYGMRRIDLDELEARQEEDRDRQFDRDELGSMLDDYLQHGGDTQALLGAVQALVDAKAAEGERE